MRSRACSDILQTERSCFYREANHDISVVWSLPATLFCFLGKMLLAGHSNKVDVYCPDSLSQQMALQTRLKQQKTLLLVLCTVVMSACFRVF
jgi:hypothetical protein